MTVADLIEELQSMPATAMVLVIVRRDYNSEKYYEFIERKPLNVVYDMGIVKIDTD